MHKPAAGTPENGRQDIGTDTDIARMTHGRAAGDGMPGGSEEIFRLAMQHAPVGMALHGPDTEWIEFNEALCEFFDYTPEKMRGKSFLDLTHPDDADAVRPYRAKILSGELPYYQIEKRYIHKSGAVIWGLLKVAPIWLGPNGDAILISQIQDITQRKQAEAATGEYERSLRASEKRFRLAMNSAPIGMALSRPDGVVLAFNDAVCDLFGYTRAEIGKLTFLDITHADDLDVVAQELKRLVAREIDSSQVEKRYIHKSGRVVWVQLSMSRSGECDEGLEVMVCHFLDITERKKLDEVKNEFVSVVSHELRTPLTSIRGSLGLILGAMTDQLTPDVERLLGIAHNNCERLIPLINDILDLDKIAAGKMRFDIGTRPVDALIAGSVEANAPFAEKFGVAVTVETPATALYVLADPDRARQVLDNLLSNAVKFTPEDGTVRIRAERRAEAVRITVADEGDGVPDEFADRIFTRFSQADSSVTREVGGTGLGLHISKQIVEKMSGRIGFDNVAGAGASFWFELPAVSSPGATLPIGPAAAGAAADLPVVLHIEDDLDFVRVLSAGLDDVCRVEAATSCAIARRALADRAYDLVVLDLDLPDGNPRDLLAACGGPIADGMPLIVVSNDEVPADVLAAVDAAFIKARTPEARIRERIRAFLQGPAPERAHAG